MRGVDLVGAEDAAGADDADGRLARKHGARLNGAGVRTQNDVVVDIKGVLRIARRVILGDVEQFEIVMIQLNFGAFDHLEAEADEAIERL